MNHIKLAIAIALASANSIASMSAQQVAQSATKNTGGREDSTMNQNIEIVKEYNPTIKEAGKINSMPELKDVDTKKLSVDYSVWASPVNPSNDSVPALDYAMPKATSKPEAKEGFIKLGGGNHISFLGEAYLPLYRDKKNLFDLSANHNSTFGKVRFTKSQYKNLQSDFRTKAKMNDNDVRLGYIRSTQSQKELSVYAQFGYRGFNYYGYDESQSKEEYGKFKAGQSFTNFDAGIRFRTMSLINNKFSYDVQTNYQLFHTKTDLSEHNIVTKLLGTCKTSGGDVNVLVGMDNNFLSLPADDEERGWIYSQADNMKNNTVISIIPSYVITGEKARLNIGAKGFFSINQGQLASVTPDIYGSVTISSKYWFLYGGVSGDYKINNYHNMSLENKFVSGDFRAENTYIPIDVYLGNKINIANYAMLDINASYKVLTNPYFFINDIAPNGSVMPTDSLYYGEDEGLFNIGATITSNIKNKVDLSLSGKINKWAMSKGEKPWMLPTTEANFTASYLATNYLRFKLSYDFSGGRKALVNNEEVKMNNVNDLSLGVTYKVMSFVNVFLDLNNVLNQRYESWYGYVNQGFNFIVGAVATF